MLDLNRRWAVLMHQLGELCKSAFQVLNVTVRIIVLMVVSPTMREMDCPGNMRQNRLKMLILNGRQL